MNAQVTRPVLRAAGRIRDYLVMMLAAWTVAVLFAVPVRAQDAGSAGAAMSSIPGNAQGQNARDANAYSDGYTYGSMPALEKYDQLAIGTVLANELETVTRNGETGAAWKVQASYGPDLNKLWVRTEGAVVDDRTEDSTGGEALWWHAIAPYWATQIGLRQDIGPGSHTWAAFGIEGLAPYFFDVEATGYVGDDGRLMAHLEGSYDLLITNRLILTPKVESIFYDRTDRRRGTGTGLGSLGAGIRLRYEITRKFAPYVGYVWDRSMGSSGRLGVAAGEGDMEVDSGFVAGVRVWW